MNFLPSPLLSALALASLISLQAGAAVIQSIERSYDPLGRLSKESRSDGGWVSYGYDANGNRTESRDHLGRVTLYGYDALNRLVSQTDPAGGLTRFSYDAQDNLVSVTDPRGLITQYQYNGLNELLRQISPDTGTTVVARLESGLTASVTDAKQQTTSYAYDTAGRVSALTYADGKTLSYGYGSNGTSTGKLTSLSDASGSITYTHDSQGRVATETRTIWSKPYLTRYGYDAQGRLATLTYPSGRSVSYSYDSAGQVSLVQTQLGTAAAKTVLSNLSYRPFGQVQGWTYGNGEVRSSSYDNLNQLTTLSLGDSTLTLSYDNAGRITSQQISGGWWERLLQKLGLPVGQTHRYRYDALDRLTEWEDGRVVMRKGFPYSPSTGYSYDATGNRQSHRADDMVFKQYIDAKSNRLTAASYPDMRNPVFEYDANGSRIQEGGNHYSYDARGRLIEVAGAQFTVNALGERVAKTYQGATTLFHYDQWGRLIAETDANGAVKREYLYLGELPVALVDNGMDLRNIHTDHLGTPRLVTDATQHAIWAWPLGEPFGNTPANEDPEDTGGKYTFNLRFPGQYFDKETGHHYNYFRDYDPQNGRYVQSDPIGLEGGINTYAYVGGNPLSYYDPYGLFGMDDVWGGVYWATGGWSPSQGTVDFSAGLGDALLLGTGGYLRDAAGVDGGVDQCSDAYRYGSYAALAVGGGRMAYAGLAKAGSVLAASGAEASAFRAGLKTFFRGGIGRNWRPPNLAGKTDAQLRASAGKTNLGMNAYGAGVGAAGGMGAAQCGCPK